MPLREKMRVQCSPQTVPLLPLPYLLIELLWLLKRVWKRRTVMVLLIYPPVAPPTHKKINYPVQITIKTVTRVERTSFYQAIKSSPYLNLLANLTSSFEINRYNLIYNLKTFFPYRNKKTLSQSWYQVITALRELKDNSKSWWSTRLSPPGLHAYLEFLNSVVQVTSRMRGRKSVQYSSYNIVTRQKKNN